MPLPLSALRRGAIAVGAAALLSGCVDPATQLANARLADSPQECTGSSSTACFFINSPVKVLQQPVKVPGRILTFFPTADRIEFVDGQKRRWVAPRRTLTDGASIPFLFMPIVGSPQTREFRNAAAVHDAYCGIGNEDGAVYHSDTWQNVHRMFYDTLIVGGTNEVKAKVMFAAVWLGGPRWYVINKKVDPTLDRIPDSIKTEAMVGTKAFIERTNPPMPRLMQHLRWREQEMLRKAYPMQTSQPAAQTNPVVPIGPVVPVVPIDPVVPVDPVDPISPNDPKAGGGTGGGRPGECGAIISPDCGNTGPKL